MPRSTSDAEPEKIAITMSDAAHDDPSSEYFTMSRASLIRRIMFTAELLYDLEMERRPLNPATAVRYDRLIETLADLVDELARRA